MNSIHHIREHRKDLDIRVKHLQNVHGSMIGLRIQNGKATNEVCFSVLVHSKRPKDELRRSTWIPRSIRMGGKLIPVDVVELRPMRPQFGVFSDSGPICVSVENSTGTIGAFCRSPNGFFALTCAHVLGSTGSDPLKSVPVKAWSSITRGWTPIGRTLFSVSGQGAGVHGEFGFLDAGLSTLEHPELIDRAQAATQIATRSCTLGEIVHADGAAKGLRQGSVIGIEQILTDFWADAVIQVVPPGTFGGDSGMLWKDTNGEALAIHAFGENVGDGSGSLLTAAMFANRASIKLGVDLLSVPN